MFSVIKCDFFFYYAKSVVATTWPSDNRVQYLPQWVLLLREHVEVVDSQLQRRHGEQSQVGPALQEPHQPLKGVQRHAVIAIVIHVSHEDVELHTGTK